MARALGGGGSRRIEPWKRRSGPAPAGQGAAGRRRRTKGASDTRTRLLDAAARLFHEQGYHATGIATILREAQVNSGSLYHYFPSKEALLSGVLERYTELLHPLVIGPVEAQTGDPIERVFGLLEQYRRWLAPLGFSLGCPIGNLALEVSDSDPEARALVSRNFAGWIGAVRGWLEAAGDRLPRGLDRAQLAQLVLTVMEGGVMQARAAGSPGAYQASVGQLRSYFDLLERKAKAERVPRKAIGRRKKT